MRIGIKKTLVLDGLDCANCAQKIETAIKPVSYTHLIERGAKNESTRLLDDRL